MQRRTWISALALGALVALGGCSTPKVTDYAAQRPVLDMREYFNGTLDAYGVFTDRSGAVVKRFTVVMDCSWNGNEGVLDEAFTYSDGTHQRRVWRLTAQATVGPVNVYRRQLGAHRLVVMGEVPALAVKRLGDGIERRRK